MDVNDEKFGNLIYTRRQYIVPIWQREYNWGFKQWSELWTDLLKLCEERFKRGKSPEMTHFMGSIVLKPRELGGVEKYVLIDGQQRISTLVVILALIRNLVQKENPTLSDTIQNSYLLNRDIKSTSEQFKLRPSVTDNPGFEKMMGGSTDIGGKFGAAYEYYNRRLDEEKEKGDKGCELEKLKEIITDNLKFVEIILSEKDDSNRIFETLNSRGLELEPADLLRNFFMMKIAKESEAENLYKSLWLPMQQNIETAENLTEFFRHYLTMESHGTVKEEKVYNLMEERMKWWNEKEIVAELHKAKNYSEYYQRLLFPKKEQSLTIQTRLNRLNVWTVTTSYPLLLKAYLSGISESEMARVIDIVESFVVRRYICNVKTNSLNNIFAHLCNLGGKNIVTSIEQELASYSRNYRWPDNEEFAEAFQKFPLYKGSYSKCWFIMVSLEQSFEHPEKIDFGNLTVEHVMPETLTDWWKDHLGPDWQRVHNDLKDTIGNLTFVAEPVNPSLSNQPFTEKKKWFMKTKVELSASFKPLESWREKDIVERAEALSKQAIQIWEYPS